MALPEPGSSERDRLIEKLCWVVAITLLITHASLAWLGRMPAVTPAANDDALYLLLARSLGSFHYVDQHLVGSPIHAQYPPGYPAALALAASIFGSSLNVAQAVTILFSTAALLLIFDLARRLAGPVVGVLTLACLVFNLRLLDYAGRVATEAPYMALSVATLWVLTVLPESRKQYALAGFLAIFGALTRSVGVSLVAAVLLFWLFRRRFRPALIFGVVSAVTVGGWLYWTSVAPNQFTERSYVAVATKQSQHFSSPVGMVVTRSANFVKMYVAKSMNAGLEVPTLEGTGIDNAIWIAAWLILGGVGLLAMRKRAPSIPLYFLVYCGVLILYPYKMTRFFMPVTPLLLVAAMVGAVVLFRRWGQRTALVVCTVISLAIVANASRTALTKVSSMEKCDRSQAMTSKSCFSDDRLAFFEATRYASTTLPSDAAVLTIKEATFYYYSGHSVLHPDLAILKGKHDVLGFLQKEGIEYVLISAFVGGAEISQALLPECSRIEVVRDFGTRTILLRIRPGAGSVESNACASLEALKASIEAEAAEALDDATL